MRKQGVEEIFEIYVKEQHWLFMDRTKMISIMLGIRSGIKDVQKWEEAYALIKNSTPDEIEAMKAEYYKKYRAIKQADEALERFKKNRVILFEPGLISEN